ncbi:MAG: glycosyltransferase family 2 protein [Bacteroidetes bacterium]|nr:glycosyltransferase family 2 protein [Bacteroidota bacterium]
MNQPYAYKLAVVIVNYNVKYFLEQCLNSVLLASQNISCEIFVVDNLSVDGSVEMVKSKFPAVHLIENKINVGFSKANNQAIQISNSEFVLLLNPDTVVKEDTFEKIIHFMDEHSDAGGLGVKMVDGKGDFLPESKRALPSPAVAFWKIFGFSSLFPRSKTFGRYHLGHLSKDENHSIEILSGAFMFMRKSVLDEVGLLDESFFMYGEDIDLSYRIVKSGYKNYYFSDTSIIHYKGESTKKSSVNYVLVFYKAMIIFAQKHFSTKNARFFGFLIYSAIYLRAGAAICMRLIKAWTLPIIDSVFIIGGMLLLTRYWHQAQIEFPAFVTSITIPIYGAIWLLGAYINGLYDTQFKWKQIGFSLLQGTLLLLIVYGLLPKDLQFSRLFIFVGLGWSALYILLSRVYLHLLVGGKFKLNKTKEKSFIILGGSEEYTRITQLLKQTFLFKTEILHFDTTQTTLIDIERLKTTIEINKMEELIFCAKDITSSEIIEIMTSLRNLKLEFKIAQPTTDFLIGSNSIDSAGDLYLINLNKIEEPKNIRIKRIFDFSVAFLILLCSPIIVWFYSQKSIFIRNILSVISGKISFVGFDDFFKEKTTDLPRIKKGIFSPSDNFKNIQHEQISKVNLLYARNYNIWYDMKLLKKGWKKLDKSL